jgi:hypothetical protein
MYQKPTLASSYGRLRILQGEGLGIEEIAKQAWREAYTATKAWCSRYTVTDVVSAMLDGKS